MCMSLIMLLYTETGEEISVSDLQGLAKEVGFKDFDYIQLAGPSNAGVLYKGAKDTTGKMWKKKNWVFYLFADLKVDFWNLQIHFITEI